MEKLRLSLTPGWVNALKQTASGLLRQNRLRQPSSPQAPVMTGQEWHVRASHHPG